MQKTISLALDAMGGDKSPFVVFDGALLALKKKKNLHFHLFGRAEDLYARLLKIPKTKHKYFTIHDCPDVVDNSMKPSVALRAARNSSMRKAIDFVQEDKADAVVSAGNTGAFMALARFVFRTYDGIDRPALPALMPSLKNPVLLLDAGANVGVKAYNLLQFAAMGVTFYKELTSRKTATVGLLNIGSEETKGHEYIKDAHLMFKETDFNYHGFVEGDDLLKGTVDVVVTDGFSGNIALKATEGAASFSKTMLQKALKRTILARVGSLFAFSSLKWLKSQIDPRAYNGTVLLGLKKIAIKSHGGADAFAYSHAILTAARMSERKIAEKIQESLFQISPASSITETNS